MFPLSSHEWIIFLQALSPEVVSTISFLVCAVAILVLFRYWGVMGLGVYSVVAVIAANLQALKLAEFSMLAEPVALGTVVFTSSFLAMDIATEAYGKAVALKIIWLSFMGAFLWWAWMLLTLGVAPAGNPATHNAMVTLFTPSTAILVASIVAYLVSQTLDVIVFQKIKELTVGKWVGLRMMVATGCASLVDTIVFSTCAWVWFAPYPVSLYTLVHSYILGTFIFRMGVVAANVPVMYWARNIINRKNIVHAVSSF